jgi:signal transduction histidine kinase/ligand-binding sensor domain-containing protein
MLIRRTSRPTFQGWRASIALIAILGWTHVFGAAGLQIAQMDHTAWTAREGAPQAINSVAQAPDGTLWLGADGGLFNFDGRAFTEFKSRPGEPQLPSNVIESVCVARDGTIWVGLYQRGIARIAQGRVTLYENADNQPMRTVRALRQAPDDSIWALAQQTRIVKFGAAGVWHAQAVPLDSGSRIQGFFIDSSNALWVPQGGRLYRRSQGQVAYTPTSIQVDWLFSSSEAADGTIWMADVISGIDRGRTQHIDRVGNLIATVNDAVESFSVLSSPDGSLWMATQVDGLRRYQRDGPGSQLSMDTYQHVGGLSSNTTRTLLLDRDNNIWVGGQGGIDRFRPGRLTPFIAENPSGAWSVCTNKLGEVWIAGQTNQLYRVSAGRAKAFADVGDVYSVSCAEDGDVLYLDHSGIWNVHGDRIKMVPEVPGVEPYSVHQVVEAGNHTLFASVGGPPLGLWMYAGSEWTKVPGFAAGLTPSVAFVDSQGRLWAGYNDGKIVLASSKDRTTPFEDPDLGVIYVFSDSSYGLLVAGMNGVAVFRETHFQMLTFADQASARGVTGLIESRNGDLWLNGARGIVHVSAQEMRAALSVPAFSIRSERFAEGDFVGPSEMTHTNPSAARDNEGKLWFAMLTGVVSIDPEHLTVETSAPLVSIRSISADNRALEASGSIPPKPQSLAVQYFGVNLTAPEKVVYRYMLEGLDDGWQDAAHRTEAIYTRPPPGRYTFRVIASNGNGNWTAPVSSTLIRVLPSFYQTWWFATICGLATLVCFWIVLTMRVKYVTRAIRVRSDERADERVRIARDLHDTLLQGIQGLMLRFHVAAEKTPAGGETRELLDGALDTADVILIEARDRISRLRSSDPADINLADGYAKVATDLNYEKAVIFSIKVDGPQTELHPLVCEELYFVGREAITNAFHHAEASQISVAIKYARTSLTVTIEDNGCGFHPSNSNDGEHAGRWGLLGMMERAHRVGASFECRSSPGCGTAIIVTVSGRRAYLRQSLFSRLLRRSARVSQPLSSS